MDVVVVGSINRDVTFRLPRLPTPGETVLGSGRFFDNGGKGANQAVAAARLGSRVALIGMLGDDPIAPELLDALRAEGVDAAGVGTVAGTPSGMAVIGLDDDGENMIMVDPAANAMLTVDHVNGFADLLASASVVLAQLEVPIAAATAAAGHTRGRFVLNPAPAATLPLGLLERVSVLVPNATELGMLAGGAPPSSPEEAITLAGRLQGPDAVVVTLGASGAVLVEGGAGRHFPAPTVTAVDPTGAGDAFCGGLADALAGGASLPEAVAWAVRCGAAATVRQGAQSSLPTRDRVETLEES